MVDDGAGPLITFYDDATGERVELSARTFDNWVAKTANLLVDGVGLGPGDTAAVVLPAHWQTFVVLAGCWAAGIQVVTDPTGDEAVLVTAEGWTAPNSAPAPSFDLPLDTLLLSLRPLGAGLLRPAPDITDFAEEVRTYGDRFAGPPVAPSFPALDGQAHAELLAAAAAARTSERVLVAPNEDPRVDAELAIQAYLAPLGGGSVVLCRHADPAALERRLTMERAILP